MEAVPPIKGVDTPDVYAKFRCILCAFRLRWGWSSAPDLSHYLPPSLCWECLVWYLVHTGDCDPS